MKIALTLPISTLAAGATSKRLCPLPPWTYCFNIFFDRYGQRPASLPAISTSTHVEAFTAMSLEKVASQQSENARVRAPEAELKARDLELQLQQAQLRELEREARSRELEKELQLQQASARTRELEMQLQIERLQRQIQSGQGGSGPDAVPAGARSSAPDFRGEPVLAPNPAPAAGTRRDAPDSRVPAQDDSWMNYPDYVPSGRGAEAGRGGR